MNEFSLQVGSLANVSTVDLCWLLRIELAPVQIQLSSHTVNLAYALVAMTIKLNSYNYDN